MAEPKALHGPCALTNVTLSDGSYLVAGRECAAFTNEEEDAVNRREIVPFTCEDRLTERGGRYTKGGPNSRRTGGRCSS